jgi:arylsulfatase A-like enzyme
MREPAFFGLAKSNRGVMEMATTMDILPTILNLAKVDLPCDRVYDGYDISPLLLGTGKSLRDVVITIAIPKSLPSEKAILRRIL